MSLLNHQQTQDLVKAVHDSLLRANLKSCEKYIETMLALTSAIKRIDAKHEARLDILEAKLDALELYLKKL